MPLKSEVLTALEARKGEAVSGEKLAGSLGVSRNAVWKAVKALKKDGYAISAVTHSGYRLDTGCDLVSAEGVRAHLAPPHQDLVIFVYPQLDSTNNEAKRLLAQGLDGQALVLAETQSAGRGRLERSFYSPPATGIYMTLVLQPNAAAESVLPLTTMAAVAVCEAIEQLCGLEPQIKWVNDVYLGNKKICGILTEAESDLETDTVSSVIVGIGINVGTVDFPSELADVAGALDCHGLNRNELIAAVVNRLLAFLADPADKSYLESYRSHSLVLGREISYLVEGWELCARAVAIDDLGGLVIELADGSRETLRSGEISVRLAEQ
jgi:BirA family transcriptional regulator, biotin operon repressor / biotin---[acetyl-CoA-carboxylase] ligase